MHILEDDLKVCPCLYLLFQCFIFGTKIIIAITIFSHASPFYLAYRGQCLCYSGEFICAKHDTAKGSKKGGAKVQGKEEYFASSNKKHVVALNGIFLMYTCRIERNWRYVVGVPEKMSIYESCSLLPNRRFLWHLVDYEQKWDFDFLFNSNQITF